MLIMRIHRSMACVAIASVAALTAVAAPADAGTAGTAGLTLHQKLTARALFRADAECTIKPASVNVYTASRDITFSVPSATQEWALVDDTDDLVVIASDAPSLGDDNIGPTFTFDPRNYTNSQAGKITVDVFTGADLGSEDEWTYCEAPFSFRRGSKISATLKVKDGYRTLSGSVKSASWGAKPKYVNVKSGIVDVQKKINDVWVTKKTVKTDADGVYSARIRAASGDWQAVFKGTSKIGNRTSATKVG